MRTEIVVDCIETYRHRFPIERMCRILREHGYSISVATYYRYRQRQLGPTESEINDAYDAHRLYQLWVDNRCVYGRRKLWKAAQRSGWDIGRDKVDRLMRILGIEGITRRRKVRTTITTPKTPRFDDLVKRAWKNIDRPDQCWVADFTYVFTTSGVCYTAFITDVYTREILSFITDTKAKSHLVIRTLQQAISVAQRGLRDRKCVYFWALAQLRGGKTLFYMIWNHI